MDREVNIEETKFAIPSINIDVEEKLVAFKKNHGDISYHKLEILMK